VLETGLPILLSDPGPDVMRPLTSDEEEYQLWLQLGIRSRIVVPLIARGQIIGAMIWFTVESERRYNEDDLKLAEQIASRAALAVDNSRLFKAAQVGVEARDRFIAMLGHELRNPLNSISIVAKLLQRESLSDERLTKLRALIGRETKQLTTLVEDLLDVSRVLAGKMSLTLEPLDLTPLIRESVQSFEDMATQRELRLTVSIADHPILIAGDPVRMHQVIANLLTNAIKYTEPAGTVEVSLREEEGFAIITVRDSGIGIPPEFLSSIFDPFTQAAELPPHGLGLGLSVVRQVAELHGGTITASSEGLGKGSEFTVRIPLASATTSPRPADHT
jgi:signal transduction histidine kinase